MRFRLRWWCRLQQVQKEAEGGKRTRQVAADTRTALATSMHVLRVFLRDGLGQAELNQPAFGFSRQMVTFRTEAKVTQAQ